MEQQYSMAAAAALLSIDVATLRRWCAKARINATIAAHDKRSHFLTGEQMKQLAQEHNRPIAGAAQPAVDAPAQQEQIAALRQEQQQQGERIAALENSAGALSALLQEVLQRIEALESRPAPRPAAPALRPSMDATRPASAPRSASTPAAPAPGASMRSAAPLPPPVRALVATWIADHGGPAANTVRRWQDMPLEPAAALRYTQQKIAELGYRAHGAQLHRCQHAQCVCYQELPE